MINIQPYPDNAKKHPDKQVEMIAKSIKRFGWQQPIVVDKQGIIIVGHGRYQAYIKHPEGMDEPWITDNEGNTISGKQGRELTAKEVKAYRLADNKLNESDWDLEITIEELHDIDDPALQELTGFDMDLLLEPEEKDDEVPETPDEPRSKLGDLYQLGPHRVLCGDSTKLEDVERLMDGKKADMVFTDLPYGVDYDGGIQFTKSGIKTGQREKLIADDTEDIYALAIPIMAKFCDGAIYTWFADTKAKTIYESIEAVGDIHALIIWVKNGGYGAMNANYKQKHEPCLYWKPKGKKLNFVGPTTETTIWEINKDGKNKLHPTQKPVDLSVKAIKNHSVGLVLDLFLGSGATLIGCQKLNRQCYGIELNPKYVDVIVQRYVDYMDNPTVILNNEDVTHLWTKTQAKTQE